MIWLNARPCSFIYYEVQYWLNECIILLSIRTHDVLLFMDTSYINIVYPTESLLVKNDRVLLVAEQSNDY